MTCFHSPIVIAIHNLCDFLDLHVPAVTLSIAKVDKVFQLLRVLLSSKLGVSTELVTYCVVTYFAGFPQTLEDFVFHEEYLEGRTEFGDQPTTTGMDLVSIALVS